MGKIGLFAVLVVAVGCTPFVLQRDKISGNKNAVVVKTGQVWTDTVAAEHC